MASHKLRTNNLKLTYFQKGLGLKRLIYSYYITRAIEYPLAFNSMDLQCGMKVLDFLEIIKGAELFLNPGADYSKEFTKEEIENILNGSIWKPSEHFVVKQDTQILIGQPKNYPTQLVEELIKLFQKDKNVERAYIAHYHNPEENDPPHTLVGIAVKKYSEQTFAQAGIVVTNVEVPDPPVDFIRVQSSGGLSDYFNKSKPFYKRKKFGFF